MLAAGLSVAVGNAQPVINQQPASQIVASGDTAALSVVVAGTPPLFYQWDFNGTVLPNATNAALTLANVQTNAAGNYIVIVTNGSGSVTSLIATLTVLPAGTVIEPLTNEVTTNGGNAAFSVAVLGGPFTYQWQFDGAVLPGSGIITTMAGNGTNGYSGNGGAATNASLSGPGRVAIDAQGNLFISDAGNNVIRKMDTNGIITTVAGGGSGGDGGAATNASLNSPAGVAVDGKGNLFIADKLDERIRKVDANGIITTVAGNGSWNGTHQSYVGPATSASLDWPGGVAVDGNGNLFIADDNDSVVRKVDTNGIITTVAGCFASGYSGDGGPATNARLYTPSSVAVDDKGNLFISDVLDECIRRVDTNGIITTVAGNAAGGFSGDGGPATNALLNSGWTSLDVAVDGAGNLFIVDYANQRIREIGTNGIILTVAGNGSNGYSGDGGPATSAELNNPGGVAVDGAGNLFIADTGNNVIRKLDFTSLPTLTLVHISTNNIGNYSVVISNSTGVVTNSVATLNIPPFLIGQPGNLTVLQSGSGTFNVTASGSEPLHYQWTLNGTSIVGATNSSLAVNNATTNDAGLYAVTVTNLYGSAQASATLTVAYVNQQPTNEVVAQGGTATLSVSLSANVPVTYQWQLNGTNLPTSGIITTVAGDGTSGYSGDGEAATNASLNAPNALTVDSAGNIFFVDSGNNRVRKVDTNGTITTVAGNGTSGFSGDGGPATNANLGAPTIFGVMQAYGDNETPAGVAVDGAGNLFISDAGNYRVRKVDPWGTITTVAGNGTYNGPYFGDIWSNGEEQFGWTGPGPTFDGNPATNAPIGAPFGLAVNAAGDLFIVDAANQRLQWLDTNGVMMTAAATLYGYPSGVAVDTSGNAFVVNYGFSSGGAGITEVFTNGITTNAGGFSHPSGVAVDGAGRLYIAANGDARIWGLNGVNPSDTPWLVAGNGTNGYSGDGGAATSAEFSNVCDVTVDRVGNVFIADSGNNRIRKVSAIPPTSTLPTLEIDNISSANVGNYSVIISGAGGSVTSSVVALTLGGPPVITVQPQNSTVLAGSPASFSVSAVGDPESYQWLFNGAPLSDQTNATLALPAVTTNNAGNYSVVIGNTYGSVTSAPPAVLTVPTLNITGSQSVPVGGNATFTIAVPGPGPFSFQWQKNGSNYPQGVTQGIITTVAGIAGLNGYSGDGGPATSTMLNGPMATAVDPEGNLFIADTSNYRIRRVDLTGTITTVAGTGTSVGNIYTFPNGGNGNLATSTPFGVPIGVAVNSKYRVYVPDCVNYRVQVVSNGFMETAAGANDPMGVVVDGADNLFIADASTTSVIRKVDTKGVMTIVAGNGTAGFSGDGGAATKAQLNWPQGIAVDSVGNLFIADSQNNRIRKVDTNGIITTVAGNGAGFYSGDGIMATNAEISTPTGVAVDPSGRIYIADQGNSRIRAVDPNGIITTVVGLDLVGYSGDGGLAFNATLAGPIDVTLDRLGNMFITDKGNNVIRKVPIQGPTLVLPDVSDADAGDYQVIVTSSAGSVTSSVVTLTVVDPPVITTPPANQLVFVGQLTSFNVAVRGASPLSYQWTFNGTNLAGQTNVSLNLPSVSSNDAGSYAMIISNVFGSVTSSPPATLLVAPSPANEIGVSGRNISFGLGNLFGGNYQFQWQRNGSNLPSGIITVAGNGSLGSGGDYGMATNAELSRPMDVTVYGAGNLFIADYWNSKVREVFANGVIIPVAGYTNWGYSGDGWLATAAELDAPEGVAVDAAGNFFIADSANNCIRKVDGNDYIWTVAGNGTVGYSGDGGAATNAELARPTDVAVDGAGNLYIADYWNSLIRKVDTTGIITTVAGLVTNGYIQWGYSGDGGAATNAELDGPVSIELDAVGDLFIADSVNDCIRKVDTNGIITTVAGVGWAGYTGDGGPATNAAMDTPSGVVVGPFGELFISDSNNQRIRKVDTNGIITTVAGNGTNGYSGDGGPATNAALSTPAGIGVDADDNLFIADSGNNRIREVFPVQSSTLMLPNIAANAGSYRVIVTGPSGSLTSSVINLTILSSPLISQSAMNADGSFTLGFMSQSGSPSVVLCATNLSFPMVWQPIYTNSSGGIWQFTDTNTGGAASKFYRLLMP